MTKFEFLELLKNRLQGLPQGEINERVNFYSEMIDDKIEDGILAENQVEKIGDIDDIVSQILADVPLFKIAAKRIKPKRRLSTVEIILLTLGSPVWLSLLISLFAVIFSVYVSVWAVIISLWAIFVSLLACAVGLIPAGVIFIVQRYGYSGLASVGVALFCAGISIFFFFGCKYITKRTILLTKKISLSIKTHLIKRRACDE